MSPLTEAPAWFMQLSVLGLGGYFLWSIKGVLADFKDEVRSLKALIGKLFDQDKDFEKRLSAIEGRCEATHHPGGRRTYDPEERLNG